MPPANEKKHTQKGGWKYLTTLMFSGGNQKIPKMRCLFGETNLHQDIPKVISSKKCILKFIPLRAQILYVIVYWTAQLPLDTYQAFIKGEGRSHVSLECALPPPLTTATDWIEDDLFLFGTVFILIIDSGWFSSSFTQKTKDISPTESRKGSTPPKFNSEFSPEKWWLEDYPFKTFWDGHFSGVILIVYTPPVAQGLG